MVISASDVKIEQAAENEERKELKELKKALGLIEEIQKLAQMSGGQSHNYTLGSVYSVKILKDCKANLEEAAREIANARMHQARLRSLAKRLYNDIKDIRSARGEKGRQLKAFLTKVEANTLARCNNIKFVLDEAFAKAQQAKGHLHQSSYGFNNFREDLNRVHRSVQYAFNLIIELFRIEKQVEEVLEAATKPDAR